MVNGVVVVVDAVVVGVSVELSVVALSVVEELADVGAAHINIAKTPMMTSVVVWCEIGDIILRELTIVLWRFPSTTSLLIQRYHCGLQTNHNFI